MGDVNLRLEPLPVFVPLLAVVCLVLAVRALRAEAGDRWSSRYIPIRVVTAVYLAGVLAFTFFPFQIMYGKYADSIDWYNQINWVPLITLDPSAVPNVIMTIPLGILLPLISRRVISWRRAVIVGALFSLAIEISQVLGCVLFNNYRGADINDVLVNTLGCALGYGLVRGAAALRPLGDLAQRYALPGSAMTQEPRVRVGV
ncbi:VanZ family protein [Streptomyces fagopyri]|uniref:VanZ family protein n=1 Tax=Streptomyces fagopyri TaxID=2662397 RepID=UPI00369721FA